MSALSHRVAGLKQLKHSPAHCDMEAKREVSKSPVTGRLPDEAAKREREIQTMTETVINAAKALLAGRVPDGAFGPDVQFAVRGYRAGMVDRKALLETVAHTYRKMGKGAMQFDGQGNLRKV